MRCFVFLTNQVFPPKSMHRDEGAPQGRGPISFAELGATSASVAVAHASAGRVKVAVDHTAEVPYDEQRGRAAA